MIIDTNNPADRCFFAGMLIFFTMVLLIAVWTESWAFLLRLFITAVALGVLYFLLWICYGNKNQSSITPKEIENRKKDYENMLNKHLITQENYEKMIKQLDNIS